MKRNTNIFDKIGTLIPGYKGYQERNGRRECDRQLRVQISDLLFTNEKKLQPFFEKADLNEMAEIEKIRKKMNNLKDMIKYSPYGASTFFSDSELKESELENIYDMDLDILNLSNNLNEIINHNELTSIQLQLQKIEESILKRNQFLKDK